MFGTQQTAQPQVMAAPAPTYGTTMFNTQQTAQPPMFNTQQTAQPPMFNTQQTAQPQMFNTQQTAQPQMFNTQQTAQPQMFNTQQTAQPPTNIPPQNFYGAIARCSIFGDDRDALMARWNLLQASWGFGKIYYQPSAPPLPVEQTNPMSRFKAMGYSAIPQTSETFEFSLIIKAKHSELEPNKQQLSATLQQALGNRPNIKVSIDCMKSYGNGDVTELSFSVLEAQAMGATKQVPPQEIYNYLNGPSIAPQLQSKCNVQQILPKTGFSSKQLQEYHEKPPNGIDARLWSQAQMDNPNPDKVLPVPLLGFKSLQSRVRLQDTQAKHQQERIKVIGEALHDLKKRQQNSTAQLLEAKRRQLDLMHRVLRVIVKQETTRKLGFAFQYEEEKIAGKLERLQIQLSAPTQFKGRISELLSQLRLHSQSTNAPTEKYIVDSFVQHDIHALLKQQQTGIHEIVTLLKNDIDDLTLINE